jgi:hypothetical protein
VLRGTGQNLLVQSQSLTSFGWAAATALTINTTATTAPNGTTTGNSLTPTVANSFHRVSQSSAIVSGITYTLSFFGKANGYKYLALNCNSAFNAQSIFDVDAGTVFSTTSGTASVASVGNGWYRCVITGTATSSTTATLFFGVANTSGVDASYAGDGTSGIFGWGAQLELGSTANTYIPTTTTAVYGTPTLSFSGVSSIGLLSNGALYLQPAGTGAIQAQATTSTTAGGNARGANAVDWQTARSSAVHVASGQYSVLGGGIGSLASGAVSGVFAGNQCQATNFNTAVLGGTFNVASGINSSAVGGTSNAASGYYGFVGNGFTNSTTANAAVTTQATTAVTSGSTAVTLSATNASIRVGQYITGTGIASDTYVSAISTTSLTLSKNATATGTPTLSFFTPHGVVVGGGNNQATGSYSFIGGGGDAGTAANRNTASGAWSAVVSGRNNIASGAGAFIGGGGYYDGLGATNNGNTASGDVSMVLGGLQNNIAGFAAFGIGGQGNTASGSHSGSIGNYGSTRGIQGYLAFSPSYSPLGTFTSAPSQSGMLILARQTTDATATALTSNTSAAGTTNQVILPNNSAYFFRGEVVSGKTAAGDTKGWTIEGVIKRGANAASTALVGIPTVTSTYADLGAATWDIAVTADTTNGGIRVTFTGQAATTIRTVCQIRTTEMTF